MNNAKIIDISLPLNEKTPVYPGTAALVVESSKSQATKSVLSTITLSSHTGTHIDAPRHADEAAKAIDALPLSAFVGTCRVIEVPENTPSIEASYIETLKPKRGERLLFKTRNSRRGFDRFYEDFVYFSAEGATRLADFEIGLVGIDSWSIKKKGSQDNTPHSAFLDRNIPILEGINLRNAPPGHYILVALPLALTGIDGAPARAILIDEF